ncbi:unnamed protein product [Ceratitis capitata]|uniref:(Mediterranean fruit fly) hypothetical protein n=1 Tax=Ceratitis capitata TaxID=7213 RepID=A0A811U8X6_CERCA|nr:unnamed protein product [Ceratitis capitata]
MSADLEDELDNNNVKDHNFDEALPKPPPIIITNVSDISGTPTYWPSDSRKTPDFLDSLVYPGIPCCKARQHIGQAIQEKTPDFLDSVVYPGIPCSKLRIESSNDLSSDHSPLIALYNENVYHIGKPSD